MYAALWRILPGPLWVRVLQAVVLIILLIAVLFTWVFPWINELTNPSDATTVGMAVTRS